MNATARSRRVHQLSYLNAVRGDESDKRGLLARCNLIWAQSCVSEHQGGHIKKDEDSEVFGGIFHADTARAFSWEMCTFLRQGPWLDDPPNRGGGLTTKKCTAAGGRDDRALSA
jgi:hypothetical protein